LIPTSTPRPTSTPVLRCGSTCGDSIGGQCPADHTCYQNTCVLNACLEGVPCDASQCVTLKPTKTPTPIVASPTRITLPDAGFDFPVKAIAIVGIIVTLFGFLILL